MHKELRPRNELEQISLKEEVEKQVKSEKLGDIILFIVTFPGLSLIVLGLVYITITDFFYKIYKEALNDK